MSKDLVIVWAGRHRRDRWEELISGYRDRLSRFLRVTDRPVKMSASGSVEERRRSEGRKLLDCVPADSWTIALDRRGEMLDSRSFSSRLGGLLDEWQHPICFVIGSDVGLSSEFRAECRWALSFGPMTLPHELARLLLYEQLYRALAIRAGINYHR